MIDLITVERHGYLAKQIVQMFITIKKLLPSLHQHRINIDTVKHVRTKPYIFVRFNTEHFSVAWRNGIIHRPYLGFGGWTNFIALTERRGTVAYWNDDGRRSDSSSVLQAAMDRSNAGCRLTFLGEHALFDADPDRQASVILVDRRWVGVILEDIRGGCIPTTAFQSLRKEKPAKNMCTQATIA